ncbi:membrane protein [Streptomyces fulvoviolaceus]|uniref:membrane protein n=1 Tax=Streptomyces fulvoviolaceus TaxID=285535 RepID=UPI0004C9E35D|nr:membrane protein [Streptomyces fulvoviolaceus]
MGIESDQVVYEYLSRVGDVAHQRQLPSSTRMRLVSELRNEIDRRRAKAPVDSPAAVRRIISRLGSPDDVVAAAGDGSGTPQPPPASVPVQRDREGEDGERRPKGLRKVVPRPRPAAPAPPAEGNASPHLAGVDELGDSASQPDWWRVDSSPFGVGDSVPGFVGGVEIPELLKPPPPKEEAQPAVEKAEKAEEVEEAVPETRTRFRRRLLPARTGTWTNPLLLLAAGLLIAGAVLGNLFVLLVGWVIAYASRRLTDAETKWAVMFLPALALTGGLVWLWGRNEGRWGEPIAQGHMNDAVADTWPWVVRGAAVASALFLVWRSQRRR